MKLGKIYFVKAGDFVKIGFTDQYTVKNRIMGLQTGNPLKLELIGLMIGQINIEKSLHATFSDVREHGEWFRLDSKILSFIENFCITDSEKIAHLESLEEDRFEIEDKIKQLSSAKDDLHDSWIVSESNMSQALAQITIDFMEMRTLIGRSADPDKRNEWYKSMRSFLVVYLSVTSHWADSMLNVENVDFLAHEIFKNLPYQKFKSKRPQQI